MLDLHRWTGIGHPNQNQRTQREIYVPLPRLITIQGGAPVR